MRGFLGDTYELMERLSTGGMAEIFRARRHGVAGFERILAVKRILPSVARDPSFVTMFLDEARIAANLSHPNIIQTIDFGVSNGEYFLAMELVDGVDLRTAFADCRARDEPMPVRYACRIISEVCDALSYAYNKRDDRGQPMRVVHRDVTPSNVLISHCGTVKLIDFGLARATERQTRTRTGILKGKFRYLAPEQVLGRTADHRSDVFSAGILLWELLTRCRLFDAASDWGVLERIRACEVPPVSDMNAQSRPELDDIVARALAPDPDDRYQDAGELSDRLRDYARTYGEHCSARDLTRWVASLRPEREPVRPPSLPPPPCPKAVPPPIPHRARAARALVPPPIPPAARSARALVPPPIPPPVRAARASGPPPLPFDEAPTIARVRSRRQSTNRHVVSRRPTTESRAATTPDRVRVHITSQPTGASVLVTAETGKTSIGTTPMHISVDRGARYRLVMRKPGHAPIHDTLRITSPGPASEAYTLCPLLEAEPVFREDSTDVSAAYAEYSVR